MFNINKFIFLDDFQIILDFQIDTFYRFGASGKILAYLEKLI